MPRQNASNLAIGDKTTGDVEIADVSLSFSQGLNTKLKSLNRLKSAIASSQGIHNTKKGINHKKSKLTSKSV